MHLVIFLTEGKKLYSISLLIKHFNQQQPAAKPRPTPTPAEPRVDQPTTQTAPAAPRGDAPGGRLPMPPRPSPTPAGTGSTSGAAATPKPQNPPTQAIDQPVEARG
jgi:hypothetical protein